MHVIPTPPSQPPSQIPLDISLPFSLSPSFIQYLLTVLQGKMIPIAAWTSITILGWTYVLNALFHFLVQCAQRQGVQPSLTYYALRSLPAAPRALTHTVPNADGVELGQIDEIEEGLLGLLDLVKHPAICHLPNSGTLMSHNGTLSKAAGILFPSIRSSTLFEQDSGGHHAVDRSTETNMDVIPYTQLGMSFCPVAAVIKWMKLLMFAYALMMVRKVASNMWF